jgi:hypothetical protein
MFRREVYLTYDLLFAASTRHSKYACQHVKLASDQMRTHYDNRLANCVEYHEGHKIWLYRPPAQAPMLMASGTLDQG